jgi:hypothetical protein
MSRFTFRVSADMYFKYTLFICSFSLYLIISNKSFLKELEAGSRKSETRENTSDFRLCYIVI